MMIPTMGNKMIHNVKTILYIGSNHFFLKLKIDLKYQQ